MKYDNIVSRVKLILEIFFVKLNNDLMILSKCTDTCTGVHVHVFIICFITSCSVCNMMQVPTCMLC